MIYPKIHVYERDIALFKPALDAVTFTDDKSKLDYAVELFRVISACSLTMPEKKEFAQYVNTSFALGHSGLDSYMELSAQVQDTAVLDDPAGNLQMMKLLAMSDVPYALKQNHVHTFLNIVLNDSTTMNTYKTDIDQLILLLKANE